MKAVFPAVSVVVSTYQRAERCLRLLRALDRQTLDPSFFEVLVVDNGSTDETTAILETYTKEARYLLRPLRIERNRGPAAARNLGWRLAEAPIIAFTDDDCVPQTTWLEAGLAAMASDETVGVLQGRTRAPDGVAMDAFPRWGHSQVITSPTAQFEACNIYYRRQALAQGGGFSEEIGWWGEDASAGWQVVEAGWNRGFSSAPEVIHDVTARSLRWNLRNGLRDSNLVRLAVKHPGYRAQAFWRPWAFRRVDAIFALALGGLIVSVRWRPALVVAVPYAWCRRPGSWTPRGLETVGEAVAVDAARVMGQLWGTLRYRVAVL
ncbi:MAG: glycosyltransferase family 2 protein [Acidimicrobiales bacterium]